MPELSITENNRPSPQYNKQLPPPSIYGRGVRRNLTSPKENGITSSQLTGRLLRSETEGRDERTDPTSVDVTPNEP